MKRRGGREKKHLEPAEGPDAGIFMKKKNEVFVGMVSLSLSHSLTHTHTHTYTNTHTHAHTQSHIHEYTLT